MQKNKKNKYIKVKAYRLYLAQIFNMCNKYQNEGEKISIWTKIKKLVIKAAENLRRDKNKQKNSWFIKECQKIMDKRKTIKQIMIQNPTQVNMDTKTKAMVNKIIRQRKRLSEKKILEETEIHKKNSSQFFEKCNSIKDGFKACPSIMKDEENNLLSDPEKTVNNFKNYFEKLLNNTNHQNNYYLPYEQIRRDTVEPKVKEPSLEEIKQIVHTLKK